MLVALMYFWTLPWYKRRCTRAGMCYHCGQALRTRWQLAGWTGRLVEAHYCPNWQCPIFRIR